MTKQNIVFSQCSAQAVFAGRGTLFGDALPFFYPRLKKKCQSHMAFSSVLSFLLSTHSVDCAVPLVLSINRINSALFLPFTVLIVPF